MALDLTAIVTGLIGGGVGGAALTAVSGARQERSVWIREQRMRSYQRLATVLEEALEAVVGHPVDTALHRAGFAGLDDATQVARKHLGAINHAVMGELLVVGLPTTIKAAITLPDVWGKLIVRACPISGCVHPAALEQRFTCLSLLTDTRILIAGAMRHDVHPTRRRPRRPRWPGTAPLALSPVVAALGRLDAEIDADPRAALLRGHVQRWTINQTHDSDQDTGYVTDTDPWSALTVSHNALLQPLAAMACWSPNNSWKLAIADDLTLTQVNIVERSAARLITRHGAHDDGVSAGWVDGATVGERLYYWLPAAVAAEAASTPDSRL